MNNSFFLLVISSAKNIFIKVLIKIIDNNMSEAGKIKSLKTIEHNFVNWFILIKLFVCVTVCCDCQKFNYN